MEISKSNKAISAEATQQLQNLESQTSSQTETKSTGFAKDDSIERAQVLDPFTASFQPEQGLSAYSGSGGQTQLGQGATENNAAVSESYAAKAEENKQTVSNENSYSAIRKEIAGALGVDESDPVVAKTYQDLVFETRERAEAARIERNNQVINDALTFGRRVDTKVNLGEDKEGNLFTEFVPSKSGDFTEFVLRRGTEITEHGWFTDTTIRRTDYYDARGNNLGLVESVIEKGMETITKVVPNPNFPDAISLKPGDTRTLPDQKTTGAGLAPSTFDPQPDGRYGTTSGSNSSSSTGTTTGQTSSNDSTDSGGRFGGPQSGTEGTGRSGSGTESTSAATSLSIRAADVREDGSVLIVLSDGTSQEFPSVAEAMEWTKGQNLSAPASQPQSQSTSNDGETHTSVEGNTTVEVEEPDAQEQTDEEVEETETNENEQAAAEAEQEEEEGSQAGWGDYAETGPAPPAEKGGTYVTTSGGSSSNNSLKTFSGSYVPDDTYADKPGGPIDYGDPNDPNGSDQMNIANFNYHMGKNPSVTDPASPEGGDESATIESIRLDMAGSLRDGADSMDHQEALGLGDHRPKTGEDVNTTGDSNDLP